MAGAQPEIVVPGRARVLRGESPGGLRWESAEYEPAPELRPFIRSLEGYVESAGAPLLRRELPGPRVVVILEFGPPIQVFENRGQETSGKFPGGFVAGLDDGCTFTRHEGHQRGMQLNLTPIGARLFFDLPASEISRRVIAFGDLVPEHRNLCERLAELPDWDARFQLAEDMLRERIARSRADRDKVRTIQWFCGALESGARDMGVLADHTGYSHKHLLTLFRRYVGMPPGALARLHRFQNLVGAIRSDPHADWTELALRCGYYDQSHLNRDTRQFAGTTPTKLRREFQDPTSLESESG